MKLHSAAGRGVVWVVGGAVVGWSIPLATRFASQRYYTDAASVAILVEMRSELFRDGKHLFEIGLFNAIPFVIALGLVEALESWSSRSVVSRHGCDGESSFFCAA